MDNKEIEDIMMQEVYDTFNLNVYLFTYYKSFDKNTILLFDNNSETKAYQYYVKVMNENDLTNKNTGINHKAKEFLEELKKVIDMGTEIDFKRRQNALLTYRELKKKPDFYDEDEASAYAEQIVNSMYKKDVSPYPYIIDVHYHQKSREFRVVDEEKLFTRLEVDSKLPIIEDMDYYSGKLSILLQQEEKQISEENIDYFVREFGISPVLPDEDKK